MDVMLILVGILLATTVGVAIEYYKLLRRAHGEYEEAKGVVGDIILSFNRQLKHETAMLESLAYKVEIVSARENNALKKAEKANEIVENVEPKLAVILEDREKLAARMDDVDKKVCHIVASQDALTVKVATIEAQAQQLPIVAEANVDAVIPIKRDKALAPLTETELAALQVLTTEGPKTAPEIKWRIRLSREHTARLMKKLYESGYLERETNKIPFRYSIKREMEKMLRKTEEEASI